MFHKLDTGLRVRPNQGDSSAFPQFEKPKPVAYFSVVGGPLCDYEPSAQQLHYYKQPPSKRFPLDLNEGLGLAIKKPDSASNDSDGSIERILKCIYDQRDKFVVTSPEGCKRLNAEFVCNRGLLQLLMCTPYEYRKDWCIHVSRFNGTLYLRKRFTEQDKTKFAQKTEQHKTFCSWGYKFLQYCLTSSPFLDPDTSAPVDECREFSCLFATKLGGMDMLYGAEIDGIISAQPVQLEKDAKLDSLKFVQLNTCQYNLNIHQRQWYRRYKTLNWWCKSFLVGIQDLYVGMRDELGFVQRIEHMEVRSLPKQGAGVWTSTTCAKFLIEFLLCLKKIMAEVNCPHTVYEFSFNSRTGRITYESIKSKSSDSILPDYYIGLFRPPASDDAIITLPPQATTTAAVTSNILSKAL